MRRISSIVALIALIALSLPGLAAAHSELVTSTPKDGAVLDAAPTTITAVFTEEFDLAGSGLTVEDASGARVDQDDARLDPADASQKTMLVSLKSGLSAGSYTVRWTTLAADGDTDEGSFSFTVRASSAAASPGAGASPSATASPSAGSAGAAPSDTASTLPATGGSGAVFAWLIWLALALCGGGLLLRRQIRRA